MPLQASLFDVLEGTESGVFDELSALEKIKKVKVTPDVDTRVSHEDYQVCKKEEKLYHEAVDVLQSAIPSLLTQSNQERERKADIFWRNQYIEREPLAALENNMLSTTASFVKNLCRYFSRQYNIEISSSNIIEKIERLNFKEEKIKKVMVKKTNIKQFLDFLFESMGGQTFAEKLVDEIKSGAATASYYPNSKKERFEIKNSKLIYPSLLRPKESYYCRLDEDDYKAVLRALSHYDSNGDQSRIYAGWQEEFVGYSDRDVRVNLYEERHETGCDKVTHFRYYKNGKWEIVFRDHQSLLRFAKDYLGVVV